MELRCAEVKIYYCYVETATHVYLSWWKDNFLVSQAVLLQNRLRSIEMVYLLPCISSIVQLQRTQNQNRRKHPSLHNHHLNLHTNKLFIVLVYLVPTAFGGTEQQINGPTKVVRLVYKHGYLINLNKINIRS